MKIPEREPCPFRENIAGRHPFAKLHETELTLAFVNPRQYERGAALVIPKRHCLTILDLRDQESAELMRSAVVVSRALTEALAPTGINVFQNNGVAAGQTVPHVHIHIVPRYGEMPEDGMFASTETSVTPLADREAVAELIRQALASS